MRDDEPSPVGLLRTLRLLADDAGALQLTRTLAVLQQAMETCRTEVVTQGRPRSSALH
jgi:hypothetical protein